MRYLKFSLSLSLIFILFSSFLSAKTLSENKVPKPLKPWVDWVLFDQTERNCPFIYNRFNTKKCAWPTKLELNISNNRSRFIQTWQVFEPSWLALPGDKKHWPQNVSINNKLVLISSRNNIPSIYLKKGKYRVKGYFFWESIPENLKIPTDSALIDLYIKGVKVKNPIVNKQGHVWLADNLKQNDVVASDNISLNVYRLLDDKIPMRVITKLNFQVSGVSREINLGQVLLENQIPISLSSRLPALLSNNGELRLQVKAGHWVVEITSRATKSISTIGLNKNINPQWPKHETWAFKAQNHLRIVKLEGATRIDPSQSKLPSNWKKFPTFRIVGDTPLVLKQIRRGDDTPQADSLNLEREMWLDFDGAGYTVKDSIKGTVSKAWRLTTEPELELGRVSINNVPQLITQLNDTDKNYGVEIRRGNLKLKADSRYVGSIRSLSASGWQQDFKSVSTVVNLPPGWRIFSASGVDNVPQTWLQKWTLLDLFIVLIISISIARLWSWQWGVFGLVTMSLIWHESGFVPQFIWLNLLAVIAIVQLLPDGKLKKAGTVYRNISVVILLLITIPFMVSQVRTGIYPQLEKSRYQAVGGGIASQPEVLSLSSAARHDERLKSQRRMSSKISSYKVERDSAYASKKDTSGIQSFDPKANVQTGPGLPQWKWNKVYLNWNGPVPQGQTISLVLISPFVHSVLNFLRVFFVAILCLLMIRSIPNIKIPWIPNVVKILMLVIALPIMLFNSNDSIAKSTDIKGAPSQEILVELKKRLTNPPECVPNCAQIQSMILTADSRKLQLKLNVHALQKIAIPLPAKYKQWLPEKIMIDGRNASALYRESDGVLWLELSKGRHSVVLSGSLKGKQYIQLPLQLKPRIVQTKLKGWSIEGIQTDGVPDSQLQLSREKKSLAEKSSKFESEQTENFPPFLIVERHLKLGLDWFVETTVSRVSPIGNAIVVNIPLLNGESVITEGMRSKDGKVLVNMSPRKNKVFWRSRLEKTNSLILKALSDTTSTEVWNVTASPVWHLEYDGIPVIKHKTKKGNWSPTWHPWPAEEVKLTITRPKGIKGNTLTIEKSSLIVKPGKRSVESVLQLTLRSSQGGQYSLDLPENSNLQSVKINNAAQSIRLEGKTITLPITPDTQNIQIVWRSTDALSGVFTTPAVDLKVDSVNHSIKVDFSRDRWVLLVGGPNLGPAVLFWGVLFVILVIAVALGYTTLTPLNTLAWILLGIGLSQVPIWMGFVVVAWLFILGLKEKLISSKNDMVFNLVQVTIAVFTFLSLIFLFVVIEKGLLGSPDMQIAGNGSTATVFNWYQDRNTALLPQAWLFSVPKLVYRLLMLGWALWLAFSLLHWLKWGWQQFSLGGFWKDISPYSKSKKPIEDKNIETPILQDKRDD